MTKRAEKRLKQKKALEGKTTAIEANSATNNHSNITNTHHTKKKNAFLEFYDKKYKILLLISDDFDVPENLKEEVLDNICKGITLDKLENAFKLAKLAGIETLGYFMFGLPGETVKDMDKTIAFAKKLKPDVVKFDIMMPLPSTPIFNEWMKKGFIVNHEWKNYNFHSSVRVYNHPNLSWSQIYAHLNKAYRQFYLSPTFLFRRLIFSLKNGTLFKDAKMFFKVNW